MQEQAAGLTSLDAALKKVQGYAAAQRAEAGRLTDALAACESRCREHERDGDTASRAARAAQVRSYVIWGLLEFTYCTSEREEKGERKIV